MAIDASIISKIPSMGPNIVGARTEGYKLADVMDQQQLSRMRLQGAQQEQQTLGQAKSLASKYDLGTTEGQQQYAAALTKLDPKLGMEALKAFTEQQSGQAKLSDEQIKLYQTKHDILDGALQPMAIAIEDAHKRGMPPAQIEASLMPAFSQTLKTLQEQKLPNGEAILNKDDIKMVSGWLQPGEGNLLRGITGAIASSKTNAKFFADRQKAQADLQTPQTLMGPDGKQHRYLVNKATGEFRDLGVIGAPPARAVAGGSGIPGPTGQKIDSILGYMAENQMGFGKGMTQKDARNSVLRGLIANNPNASAYDIVQVMRRNGLALRIAQKEGDVIGRREAGAAAAMEALNGPGGIFEQLDAAAQKVDFGSALFVNSVKLMKAGKVVSDPDIRTYLNLMTDARAEFTTLLARTGEPTESIRAAAEHAFPDKMSLPELRAAITASRNVGQAIANGNERVMDRVLKGEPLLKVSKSVQSPGSTAAPGTPPPGQTSSPGTGQAATSGITETTNEAQYNALPKGAKYRMPGDATIRVKQ
jgi:hypothetical protein